MAEYSLIFIIDRAPFIVYVVDENLNKFEYTTVLYLNHLLTLVHSFRYINNILVMSIVNLSQEGFQGHKVSPSDVQPEASS